MPFKSDKQRRAFFSKKKSGDLSYSSYSDKPSTIMTDGVTKKKAILEPRSKKKKGGIKYAFEQAERRMKKKKAKKKEQFLKPKSKKKKGGIKTAFEQAKRKKKLKDSDGDGVPDHKDCQPFNPKKQGWLHDLQMKKLKKREQKLEEQRIKVQKQTESQKEILDQKSKIIAHKDDIKKAKLMQKQAVINEIDREKKKIRELKEANRKAKQDIFNKSPTGKAVKISKNAIQKTNEFFNKPSTKKSMRKFFKAIS